MSLRSLGALLLVLGLVGPGRAQNKTLEIHIAPAKTADKNLPFRVPLSLPDDWARLTPVTVHLPGGGTTPGQLTTPGLVTEAIQPAAPMRVRRDLYFILPEAEAGRAVTVYVDLEARPASKGGQFAWTDVADAYDELVYQEGGKARPVLRYMRAPYDPTSREKRDRTYKVFHHLYDPAGERFVTNGGHTDPYKDAKKLTFPHHRGIMYGFNRITYGDGKRADTWHCTKDAHVSHEKTVNTEAGPVLGRHRVVLGWHGEKGELFAREERELTAYATPGGTLVEFASRLKALDGKVQLDGDPQHAGFQFRAANEVAERAAKQTYYLRPDGKGEPGKFRNWPGDKGHVDLPWYALSFVLDDQRYTVCYLNHPTNPRETRFSERDYGRFGGYFAYTLTEQTPLLVNYRLWLQNGEMTVDEAQALHDQFATLPKTTVK